MQQTQNSIPVNLLRAQELANHKSHALSYLNDIHYLPLTEQQNNT